MASRAGWPDALSSDHLPADLAAAAVLLDRRPAVVTGGAGAAPLQRVRDKASKGPVRRASTGAVKSSA